MERLPLFPLPTILFPGGVLPLHIFEPRYRDLVADCLESDRRFGLIFHDPDRSGPFLMEHGRVGCVVEIEQHRPLPDGRSLILTRGIERFQIEDGIESDALYYEGLVEPYVDEKPPSLGLETRRRASIALFDAVLDTLSGDESDLPRVDPEEDVSFQLASLIRLDPAWLQSILELRTEEERLERLDGLLRAILGAGGETGLAES